MNCIECDTLFEPKRKTAQFCSPYCRVKYNRKKAAEDGDTSVVWDGSECATNADPAPKSKKPSASHVVQLKERTKERIRKAQGHSSTPKTEPPQGPDAPPPKMEFDDQRRIWVPCGSTEAERNALWLSPTPAASSVTKGFLEAACSSLLADATAGPPPEALPEKLMNPIEAMHKRILRAKAVADERGEEIVTEKHLEEADRRHGPYHPYTPLPIEHHGTQNDLARQIIAKVPAPKLDPNSDEAELARLLKHQMPVKKKGGES
jgi:hypothetical protein